MPLTVHTNVEPRRWLRLSGSPYEIGLQHGRALGEDIRRFLADGQARTAVLLAGTRRSLDFGEAVREHARLIERHLPELTEELLGLADGAGISMDDACFLQLRRELVGYQSLRPQGDCTLVGWLGADGHAALGQTVDLAGDMERELCVLEIAHQRNGRRLAMMSFTGLLGYLGMNDRGLAIGLNLVLAGRWRPGIPGYLLIRHLLDVADTVDEALAVMRTLPLASSRALTFCDGRRLVTAEHVLDEIVLIEDRQLAHANHFLAPAFQPRDELNPFARNSSLRRLQAAQRGLEQLAPTAADTACLALLRGAPIDVPPNGDPRRECTVGCALMRPGRGELHLMQRGRPLPSAS